MQHGEALLDERLEHTPHRLKCGRWSREMALRMRKGLIGNSLQRLTTASFKLRQPASNQRPESARHARARQLEELTNRLHPKLTQKRDGFLWNPQCSNRQGVSHAD